LEILPQHLHHKVTTEGQQQAEAAEVAVEQDHLEAL
jgi:hypothetical protein